MEDKIKRNIHKSIIKNAAHLLLWCAGYLDDLEAATTDHYDTYYAIDNDVIQMYLQPHIYAHYADTFKEKDIRKSKTIALALGQFIFRSNEPFIPGHNERQSRFLIFPPHYVELNNSISVLLSKVVKVVFSIDDKIFNELSRIFEEHEKTKDDLVLFESLQKSIPELYELFDPYLSPNDSIIRFAKLDNLHTIRHIEAFVDENNDPFPLLELIPEENKEERLQAEYLMDTLIKEWTVRLQNHKPPKKSEKALNNDAKVLAGIEYLNEKLKDERKQIVLITGSENLFNAADTHILNNNNNKSFSDCFLRHPQAFFAHEKFFSMLESSSDSNPSRTEYSTFILDWLNLIFPSNVFPADQPDIQVRRDDLWDIYLGKSMSYNQISEVLDRPENDPRSVIKLHDDWIDTMDKVTASVLINEQNFINWILEVMDLRFKEKWNLGNLRLLIYRETLGVISTLFSDSVLVGLWSKVIREQSMGIPVLKFDDEYEIIEKYCNGVVRSQLKYSNQEVPKDELEKLHDLNQEIEKTDDTLYHAHIIHALAYAIKGHWHATVSLADMAIAIADNIPNKEGKLRYIKGREAAYLACIAKRRMSKNKNDLKAAKDYLNEAEARENNNWPLDVRFISERLAIDTRELYFAFFAEQNGYKENDEVKNELEFGYSIDEQTESLFKSTVSQLEQLIIKTSSEYDEKDRITNWVLRQTFTNYFTLLIIAYRYEWNDLIPDIDKIIENINWYKDTLNDGKIDGYKQTEDDDPYAFLILYFSIFIWHTDQKKRKEAKDIVDRKIEHWPREKSDYRKKRIIFLKETFSMI